MTETPIDDTVNSYVVTVNVDDGEDLIDMAAEDAAGSATVRMSIAEALALIASLTAAVAEAVKGR